MKSKVAENMRKTRNIMGIKQREIASAMGIYQPNISAYESGSVPLTPAFISRYYEGLKKVKQAKDRELENLIKEKAYGRESEIDKPQTD